MEDGSELCAKQQDQTRNIAPGQHCHDCADGSVNLIVVKVVQTRAQRCTSQFPTAARQETRPAECLAT